MKVVINDTIPYGITLEHGELKINIQTGSKDEIIIATDSSSKKMSLGLIGSKHSHINASHIFIEQPNLREDKQ